MRPLTAVLTLWGLALLAGALATLVVLPAARHLRSFQDGEQVSATLHTKGSCMLGGCRVEFEADGRTVLADLPVGSSGGKASAGTPMTVRYHADDAQVAVREADLGGGGAAVLAAMLGGAALLFLLTSVAVPVHAHRRRRAAAAPDEA
ncbi:hypothetical protein [Streptomyces sp. NRRL F-5135]|uniref:hypothetical protein n=1 Tax=Streptomyces sp. NRRL F-5135 TaxID=1463858 RepID=UPI00068AC4D0|nr:hypothetical protein [Streptomyces sp. NRRL F-5135]